MTTATTWIRGHAQTAPSVPAWLPRLQTAPYQRARRSLIWLPLILLTPRSPRRPQPRPLRRGLRNDLVVDTRYAPGPESRVEFFDLRTRAEDDGSVVVGRADTGDFVALPEVGATIIRDLSGGARVGEVERNLSAGGLKIDV